MLLTADKGVDATLHLLQDVRERDAGFVGDG